jgi:hypothetical protein
LKISKVACTKGDIFRKMTIMKQNIFQRVVISAIFRGLLLLRPCGA